MGVGSVGVGIGVTGSALAVSGWALAVSSGWVLVVHYGEGVGIDGVGVGSA